MWQPLGGVSLRDSFEARRREGLQQFADRGTRQGHAEEIALNLVNTVFRRDQFELLVGFDTFDGNAQAQVGAQAGDATQQRQPAVIDFKSAQEGLVDLDFVQREGMQIAEARIAGAEVVERNANTKIVELTQRVTRARGVLQNRG